MPRTASARTRRASSAPRCPTSIVASASHLIACTRGDLEIERRDRGEHPRRFRERPGPDEPFGTGVIEEVDAPELVQRGDPRDREVVLFGDLGRPLEGDPGRIGVTHACDAADQLQRFARDRELPCGLRVRERFLSEGAGIGGAVLAPGHVRLQQLEGGEVIGTDRRREMLGRDRRHSPLRSRYARSRDARRPAGQPRGAATPRRQPRVPGRDHRSLRALLNSSSLTSARRSSGSAMLRARSNASAALAGAPRSSAA